MKSSKLILLTLLFFSIQTFSQEIDWKTNIDEAINLGNKNNKDVFIYLGEKKCVPCRAVEKYAYKTEKFKSFSKNFIMVKVFNDLDESKEEKLAYFKKAKERFKTKYVPRFIIIRKKEEIANFFAYIKSPEALIEKINSFTKKN